MSYPHARRKTGGLTMHVRFVLAHLSFVHYASFMLGLGLVPAAHSSNETMATARGNLQLQFHHPTLSPMIQEDVVEEGTCPSEIYSCRGRCNYAPRFACSCHLTCQLYGNCCEDYAEMCNSSLPASTGGAPNFPDTDDVLFKCLANNLLISNCPAKFVRGIVSKDPVEILILSDASSSPVDTLLSQMLASGLAEMDVLSHCEQGDGTNVIAMRSPVTDRQTQLHYKNVFCAACHNASAVEFWKAFIRCNDTLPASFNDSVSSNHNSNLTVSTGLPPAGDSTSGATLVQTARDELKTRVLTHAACTVAWRPTSGTANGCFKDADLSHDVRVAGNEQPMTLLQTVRPERNVAGFNGNASMDDDLMTPSNDSDIPSSGLDWQHVNTSKNGLNAQEVIQKCQELTSYVEIPKGSGKIYKNKYCYMALTNYSDLGLQFCEPDIREEDRGETWFTLERRADVEGDVTRLLDNSAWDLVDGVEKSDMDKLVHAEAEEKSCDAITSIIKEGKCYQRSFLLRVKIQFTFKYSRLIKGDFNKQVDSYNSLLEEQMSAQTPNDTFCITVYNTRSVSDTNSYKHTSETEFACAMENQLGAPNRDNNNLAATGHSLAFRVNEYKNFVTTVLNSVLSTKSVIKVPVTIEVVPCIFVIVDKVTSMQGFCSEMRSEWRIDRNANAIIGGISLEGIITIICCILSDIGLLVRLALQNVVPFYKSYPGKIQFNLCLSLLFAYTLFLVGGAVEEATMSCKVIAIMTHLAFLSALFWMNVTAFEIWRTFRHWRNQVVSRGYVSLILSVFYAVGIPVLYVVSALIIENVAPTSELSPAYGEHYCWLNGSMAVAFFFVIPCSFICCMNIVFVGLTLRGLRRQRTSISEFKKSNTKTAVTDTTIVVKIILLVGITWLLGLLAALVDNQALWIIFTIINASLGFMISCVLVINKRVYYAVQNKCLCYTVESTAVVSTQVPRH